MKVGYMKILRYFIWNTFILGTLATGYFTEAQKTAGTIIGWFYVFIVISMTIGVLAWRDKKIQSIFDSSRMEWWKWILEVLFLAATIKMGYMKIAVCMFYEQLSVAYVFIAIKCEKEDNETPHS